MAESVALCVQATGGSCTARFGPSAQPGVSGRGGAVLHSVGQVAAKDARLNDRGRADQLTNHLVSVGHRKARAEHAGSCS